MSSTTSAPKHAAGKRSEADVASPKESKKLSYNEKREWEGLPAEIETAFTRWAELDERA